MTTQVSSFVSGLESSKAFENKVSNLINNHIAAYYKLNPVNEVEIWDAGMARASGYGQYTKYVNLKIDGVDVTVKVHSTDSEDYDYYSEAEMNRTLSNWLKQLVLYVLEENLDTIAELLESQKEEA
jgi:hypothetical protein